jgi:hypothetical protein
VRTYGYVFALVRGESVACTGKLLPSTAFVDMDRFGVYSGTVFDAMEKPLSSAMV